MAYSNPPNTYAYMPGPVTMEPLLYIYHNTTSDNRDAIVKSNKLYSGTYFCCTLYNGDLPTTSPYGPERIKIPIDDVLKLFTSPNWYFCNWYNCYRNTYIELLLDDGELPQPVPAQYIKVDLTNNPFINGTPIWEVRHNVGGYWVSLIVQKEIDLKKVSHEWVTM